MCLSYMIRCVMVLCMYMLNVWVHNIVCYVIRWIDCIESISYALYVMLIFYRS
ncbi:hypothetical protein BDB01DRAFT_771911 [Pilobolus umbonatus]|nr:hypothetical protein BDB01DRAFT_771878 [Pilobolus umbonatus]KAI8997664.1 hypothetical protein BDB01DRAFT_771911 [Pilobolus umbonatus]